MTTHPSSSRHSVIVWTDFVQPPKMPFFCLGGGVLIFWIKIVNFCSISTKKFLGRRILGLPDFVKKYFMAKTNNEKKFDFEISKIRFFTNFNFDKFWATFCSNYDYEVILLLRSKKRFLSVCYTPKDVFYSVLLIFLTF